MIDEEAITFAWQHKNEDAATFAFSKKLGAHRIAVLQQLHGLHVARTKWEFLLNYPRFAYPQKLNCEQSSSAATANYKAQIVGKCTSLADLTGGMAIDTIAFSNVANRVDYVELNKELFELSRHNLEILGKENISCHNRECAEWIRSHDKKFDLIFIDPARRTAEGKKVADFSACQPDILELIDTLVDRSNRVMIKASPMIDLTVATRQLGCVAEIHIVAVCNECKEVLFICKKNSDGNSPQIHCIDILSDATVATLFEAKAEQDLTLDLCDKVEQYLYEPNAAVMKSGCFKQLSSQTGLPQLGKNSHLYTSNKLIPSFPGRIFEVITLSPLTKKAIKTNLPSMKAHVVSRNYPINAAQLQQQLGVTEGGDNYIIATTVGVKKTGIVAKRLY